MSNEKTTPKKPDPEGEKKRGEQIQRQMRFSLGYLITSLIALWLFQEFILAPLVTQAAEIPYSEFKQKLADGQVVKVLIDDNSIVGEMKNPDAKSLSE